MTRVMLGPRDFDSDGGLLSFDPAELYYRAKTRTSSDPVELVALTEMRSPLTPA